MLFHLSFYPLQNNKIKYLQQLSDAQGLSLLIDTHEQDFADKTDRIIEMADRKIIR